LYVKNVLQGDYVPVRDMKNLGFNEHLQKENLHLSFSDKKNVCLVLDQTLEGLIPSF